MSVCILEKSNTADGGFSSATAMEQHVRFVSRFWCVKNDRFIVDRLSPIDRLEALAELAFSGSAQTDDAR